MDGGASLAIRFGRPKHLVGNRGGVSLAQQEVAEQIREGVALRPTEVAMRLFAFVAQVSRMARWRRTVSSGARTCGCRPRAPHLEHFLESEGRQRRPQNSIGMSLGTCCPRVLFFLRSYPRASPFLVRGARMWTPRLCSLVNEALAFVELYPLRPDLGRAPDRERTRDYDAPMKNKRSYTAGPVETFRPGSVRITRVTTRTRSGPA